MIHNLKPYPAYKDSGVPWLGEVPEHWEVRTFRALASSQKGRTPALLRGPEERAEGDLPYLSMEYLRSENLEAQTFAEAQRDLVVAQTSDIILLWDGSNAGEFFLAKAGVVSSTSSIIKSHLINPKYFFYACKLAEPTIRALTVGMGIPHVDGDILKGISFSLPPANEQSAVVRYLDHIDRRIRRYIRTKQKLIKLLEEQKQAIIHQAVTRGLNPNVQLKSSGVEWLGDVPEHWDVVALRRVTLARCDGPFGSGLKSSHYTEHGIRVVRLTNIGHAEFRNSDAAFISPMHYASLGDHSVKAGDVLIAGLGDERHPAGRACVAPAEILPAMVKADCFRFRLKEKCINPKFAALQLTATAVTASAVLSTGATRQRTNLQSTAGRMITIPPLLEQEAVLAHISENTYALNIAIDRAHREISLLREYRIRLIADVVTGKLDVREAAANLPEELNETEVLDEELVEDEEITEENLEIEPEE